MCVRVRVLYKEAMADTKYLSTEPDSKVNDAFWSNLTKTLGSWRSALDNAIALEQLFPKWKSSNTVHINVKFIITALFKKKSYEFMNICRLCASFLQTMPVEFTTASLEKEFRRRKLPIYVHARALHPTGAEAKHGCYSESFHTNDRVPFYGNYVVGTDAQFLRDERDITIQSWLDSDALGPEQKLCTLISDETDDQKKTEAMRVMNLRLLEKAGRLTTPSMLPPNSIPLHVFEQGKKFYDQVFSQS